MRKITLLFSLLMTLVLTANAQVTSLDQLSNKKKYTIVPLDGTDKRGTWCYNPADPTRLYSTKKVEDLPEDVSELPVNINDPNQQFAFLKIGASYYLYSVGGEKFVSFYSYPNLGERTILSDTPGSVCTFHQSTASNANFPWVVALDGHHIGLSTGYDCGVITFWNSTNDNGNCISITEVPGEELSEDVANAGAEKLFNAKKNAALEQIEALSWIKESAAIETAKAAINAITDITADNLEEKIAAVTSATSTFAATADKTVDGINVRMLNCGRAGNLYMGVTENDTQMGQTNDANAASAVWTFKAADGGYYLFNKYTEKYAGPLPSTLDTRIAMVENTADAGIYTINWYDTNVALVAKGMSLSDCSGLHLAGWDGIVKWYPGETPSQWNLTSVTDEQLNELITLVKTNASNSLATNVPLGTSYEAAQGSALGQYALPENWTTVKTAADAVYADKDNMSASALNIAANNLQTAVNAITINQPQVGSFYHFKGKASGNYIDGSNTVNSQAAMTTFSSEEELAKSTGAVFYLAEDNKLLSYHSGYCIHNTSHAGATLENGNSFQFLKSEGNNIGYYTIKSNYTGSKYLYDNTNRIDRTSGYVKNNDDWTIEAVTSLPVAFAKNFATLWTPVALTIPAGVTAYTATLNDEGDALTLNQLDGTIPANTGVLLYTEAIDTYNFDITADVDGVEKGSLTGQANTILASSVENNVFTLQTVEDEMGFKNYTGENLNGFKARLETSSASAAQAIRLIFGADDTTGINGVTTADKANAAIYDLSGRRVAQPAKGIYIVGGKKVLFK